MHPAYIELGGTTAQTILEGANGSFTYHPGVRTDLCAGRAVALACPGVIRGGRVLYAVNLGWPESADPSEQLGLPIALALNDAVAACLGESALRSGKGALPDLYCITLGTGIGSGFVLGGKYGDWDIGHAPVGGSRFCPGCRSVGCLDAEAGLNALPSPLPEEEIQRIAGLLALAISGKEPDPSAPIVVSGGVARHNTGLLPALSALLPNPIEPSIAPPEAKSAAYLGLRHLLNNAGSANR